MEKKTTSEASCSNDSDACWDRWPLTSDLDYSVAHFYFFQKFKIFVDGKENIFDFHFSIFQNQQLLTLTWVKEFNQYFFFYCFFWLFTHKYLHFDWSAECEDFFHHCFYVQPRAANWQESRWSCGTVTPECPWKHTGQRIERSRPALDWRKQRNHCSCTDDQYSLTCLRPPRWCLPAASQCVNGPTPLAPPVMTAPLCHQTFISCCDCRDTQSSTRSPQTLQHAHL